MKTKGIMKKAIAVTLGITMAFGALALPVGNAREQFTTASAYAVDIGDCTFSYELSDRTDFKTIRIKGVTFSGDKVEIPETITHEGVVYPVTDIIHDFLSNNKQVKTVIFPDSITYIGEDTLISSSVEKIYISKNLWHLGRFFCNDCRNLTDVEYSGTDIPLQEMGQCVFYNCPQLQNENGAICLGNWLISCHWGFEFEEKFKDVTDVKIADLGNDGVKITGIAPSALSYLNDKLETVDLEGIKYIGSNNFSNIKTLRNVVNTDSLLETGSNVFNDTQWMENAKGNDLVKLGPVLIYYRTDDNILDLTTGDFEGITSVQRDALTDSPNIDTIICSSKCIFVPSSIVEINDQNSMGGSFKDPLPLKPTYKLKKVYLDGKLLNYDLINKNENAREWLRYNGWSLKGCPFIKDMTIEKTKEVFEQMDIPYYGMNNNMMHTNTPTQEFYIRLKIHNLLSQFEYDHESEYGNAAVAFLLGGKVQCDGYAYLAHYFLECAGIEAETVSAPTHYYNITKIGSEWFESDDGWNAQNNNHSFGWFAQSATRMAERDPKNHASQDAHYSYHAIGNKDALYPKKIAERTLGDINGDNKREPDDAPLLWAYIKGESTEIDEKAADINFDGTVDVTDAVLLEQFVNSKALDMNNVPSDGFAPTVKVAFLNGKDYDNIQYLYTDREGYITLPNDLFEAPKGKKISYDVGMANQKVRITTPLQVVNVKWIDENEPDYSEPDSSNSDSSSPDKPKGILGDVNGDGTIDIEDAVMVINHVNGVTALTNDETKRADIDKSSDIDIEDAVAIISHVNGVNPIE